MRKTAKLKIFTILLIGCGIIYLNSDFAKEDYDIAYVDEMVIKIAENKTDRKPLIEALLKYDRETVIDGIFSIHYYANLFFIYQKFPLDFLSFKDSSKYKRLISKTIDIGEGCFRDFYPKGKNVKDLYLHIDDDCFEKKEQLEL